MTVAGKQDEKGDGQEERGKDGPLGKEGPCNLNSYGNPDSHPEMNGQMIENIRYKYKIKCIRALPSNRN